MTRSASTAEKHGPCVLRGDVQHAGGAASPTGGREVPHSGGTVGKAAGRAAKSGAGADSETEPAAIKNNSTTARPDGRAVSFKGRGSKEHGRAMGEHDFPFRWVKESAAALYLE